MMPETIGENRKISCEKVVAQASNPYTREIRQSKSEFRASLVYTGGRRGKWKLQVAPRLICKGSIWVGHSSTMLIKQRVFPKYSRLLPVCWFFYIPAHMKATKSKSSKEFL